MNRYANVLTVLTIVSLLFLYSCTDEEIKKIPEEPVEPVPLPSNACAADVTYGYCNRMSYFPGEQVTAYLQGKTTVPTCALTIYDLAGDSIFSVPAGLKVQAIASNDPSRNGYGFLPSAEFAIPADLKSGVYTIENKIPFIVKPKADVDVLVVYPSNTANAYATSGGKSLYTTDRPPEVSFHRPIDIQHFSRYCLNWFHTLPDISVGYITDADMDDYSNISLGKVLCLVGHNEYWTRQARMNFDQFVASGNNAIILSGNMMWWQVRYSDDDDRSKLVCYKSFENDPVADPLLKTALWNTDALQYPIISSIGADFDHGGYGLKSDEGWNGYKITNASSPLLEGTGLSTGDIIACPTTEYDGAPIAGWDENGYPILDIETMNVYKAELVGYDIGFRVTKTYPTFVVLQQSITSGIIVNAASTDWCSVNGMGGTSGQQIKTITHNAVFKLLNNEPVFTP
ncbi:MAG TPA: N,N-dimethylformamidase beta subunit family domain-containing protein [Ohtaekwangia sp.]|nr:N,N-dimethylformamidase beta subunit family domain-containing protein [Ohtaekwangia sp.]